jgi:hypothetical protein
MRPLANVRILAIEHRGPAAVRSPADRMFTP